jgi:hypothetical protein|tara:strand:+ start:2722 stop:2883 length:162 start_codon:yes stop_codon:yes gene_type:complete
MNFDDFRSIERILYIRSIRNPGTAYVQGMNDLVIPFMSGVWREIIKYFSSLAE